MRKFLYSVGVSLLLATPVAAQWGLDGNRNKKTTSFQELNEQAKKKQGEGGLEGLAGMQELLGGAFNDPKLMQEMANMGAQMGEAMDMLMKMSPEELEKQMQDAMAMLTTGDMLDTMLENSDDILKTMEETGMVPPEELAKFKKDPAYFRQKVEESFDQMKGIFQDPEILKAAAETMGGLSELYKNPGVLDGFLNDLKDAMDDDDKIEEVRQQLLKDPDMTGYAGLKEMFQTEEMQEILNDPSKWKESVRDGQNMLSQGIGGGARVGTGAGVGEL